MKRNTIDFLFETKRQEWRFLSFYQRFEQIIAVIVTIVISLLIVLALFDLVKEVFHQFFWGQMIPDHQATFKKMFGMVMTVLIAMEFKHSIIKVTGRHQSIIEVRTVILIAIMALTRKFIILEPAQIPAETFGALAASLLALGIVYWLIREQEKRRSSQSSAGRARGLKISSRRTFPGPRSRQ